MSTDTATAEMLVRSAVAPPPENGSGQGVDPGALVVDELSSWRDVVRRGLDLLLGVVLLVVFLPVMAVIAAAIAFTGGRAPVLSRQKRVGRDGTVFAMLRFRTLTASAAREEDPLIPRAGFEIPNDPRVTALGRLLRATSLAELPSLFNVLKGEMSLFGPRPLVYDERYAYDRPRAVARARRRSRELLTALPLLISDGLAFAGAVGLVSLFAGSGPLVGEVLGLWALGLVGVAWFAFAFFGLYPGVMIHPVQEFRRIGFGTFLAVSAVSLAAFGADAFWGRAPWTLGCLASCVFLVSVGRALTRQWAGRTQWWGVRAKVIGDTAAARRVADALRRSPSQGLRVEDGPVIPLTAASTRSQAPAIRWAVLATDEPTSPQAARDWAVRLNVRNLLLIDPDRQALADRLSKSLPARSVGALRVSPRMGGADYRWVKRILDLSFSVVLMVALSPLLLAIAIAVRLTSNGSVFFGHDRIGRDGQRFPAWKFRTMHENADVILREHLAANPAAREEWEATHKLRDDPRVTRFGRFLRRTSLDELAQFWNVLVGEMSLVGPRPIIESEIEKYGDDFPLYTKAMPGVTGLWQVSGRNDTTYEQRVWLDAHYVRNWSIWLDLYILARTIPVVLRQAGAY